MSTASPFLTVVMPALNEEDNIVAAIKNTLEGFDICRIDGELVVVNDGSSDSTPALVREMMKADGRLRMVEHVRCEGFGASFWDGVDQAKGEAVVFLPGDNENFSVETLRYTKLLEDVDLVMPFVYNKDVRAPLRTFLSSLYCAIINATFSTSFNYTNGTVIYRTSVLKQLTHRCKSFFYQTDIVIRLTKKGYLFAEVPYRLAKREKGKSKAFSFRSVRTLAKDYLRLVWDVNVCRNLKAGAGLVRGSLTAKRSA
ncbi:MAG: glycosyltransferase family 2 protein [Candidatus Omnitrophica bacterium]|nr:glycosyltransferase family 2 protein [Candidatus Omnitrophota bacterium]